MRDVLRAAIEKHQTGQLGVAAQLYQGLLTREPDHAEALHLLGVLHHQQGQNSRAVELIGRAVALRPNAHIYQANLAEAYRALGDFERAAGCCPAGGKIWPDYPEAARVISAASFARSGPANRGRRATPPCCGAAAKLCRGPQQPGDLFARKQGQGGRGGSRTFAGPSKPSRLFAPAQTNLGQTLLNQGQGEAGSSRTVQEAVRLDPNSAVLHHTLGNALRFLERLVDARAEYLEALRLNPNLAVSNAHLGLVLKREGQLKDASVWLKKAVELEPANAEYWEWLAELYDEMEEPADAIPCWEQVVTLQPERAGHHFELGWDYQEESRREEARQHYVRAIELQPDSGQAQMNLGGLHEELGDMGQAEAAFREALRLQPAFALPHARLATLLRGKLPEQDLAALESRLADDSLAQGPGSGLLFALAHALDGRGDYTRAGDCLRTANGITIELNADRRDYNPAEHERFVDGLIRAFDRDFLDRLAGSGLDTRRPVFVFGLPRSGTTLVEQVLASHSRIHGAGELRLARRSFDAIPALLGRSGPPRGRVPRTSIHPAFVSWPSNTSTLWRISMGDTPSESLTRCRTITCISVCCRSCFPGRCSFTAAATCATWRCRAG